MEFTNEMIEKARQASSSEELLAMAREAGIVLTVEESENYYSFLHEEGVLSDEELANVAGGKGGPPAAKYHPGQTILFLFKTNTFYKAKILSAKFVKLQDAWYYGVITMDTGDENNGHKYDLALELPVFRTRVIG